MKLVLVLIAFVISSCAQFENTQRYVHQFLPEDSMYAPQGGFSSDLKIDSYERDSFSRMLNYMQEPNLFRDTTKKETYRFTWIRSFHPAIVIRLELENNSVFIITKELRRSNDPDTSRFQMNEKKQLSLDGWNAFNGEQMKNPFWKLREDFDQGRHLDGADWYLEYKSKQEYHTMKRWSPNGMNQFREYCEALLTLSGIKLDKKKIY